MWPRHLHSCRRYAPRRLEDVEIHFLPKHAGYLTGAASGQDKELQSGVGGRVGRPSFVLSIGYGLNRLGIQSFVPSDRTASAALPVKLNRSPWFVTPHTFHTSAPFSSAKATSRCLRGQAQQLDARQLCGMGISRTRHSRSAEGHVQDRRELTCGRSEHRRRDEA
jgi:hypothetical protein